MKNDYFSQLLAKPDAIVKDADGFKTVIFNETIDAETITVSVSKADAADLLTFRVALTEQSINRSKEKSQTVSRQNMTAEYQTCGQTETLLLSNQATQIEKQIDIATTLMARDYKGFGNQSMNGVIEWK